MSGLHAELELTDPGAQLARLAVKAHPGIYGSSLLLAVLADAPDGLADIGARLEVVRSKPGCAVVRSSSFSSSDDDAAGWCPQVAAFLTSLPPLVFGVEGSLIESTCTRRGGRSCLFTLLWDAQAMPVERPEPEPVEQAIQEQEPEPEPVEQAIREPEPVEQPEPARMATPVPSLSDRAPIPADTTVEPVIESLFSSPCEGLIYAATAPMINTGGDVELPSEAFDFGGEFTVPQAPSRVRRSRRFTRTKPASPRSIVPGWLKRRGWLVALTLLAGVVGGGLAGGAQPASYRAQATMLVQSGATAVGPGNAGEAGALAITYATIIPSDTFILAHVATAMGVSEATVSSHLSASVDTGTAVLVLTYTAPTAAQALEGTSVAARAIAGGATSSNAIPPGTVSVIHLPTSASTSGSTAKYGAPVGGMLGIVLGLILVLAVERSDPRIDSAEELAEAVGCPAVSVLDDLSFTELSSVLATNAACAQGITVIPLSRAEEKPSSALVTKMRLTWPEGDTEVAVRLATPFEVDPAGGHRGSGPTVLMVRAGESVRRAAAAAARLRIVDRAPVWAVLVTSQGSQHLVAGGS